MPQGPQDEARVLALAARARKLSVHGAPVELICDVPELEAQIARSLGTFGVEHWSPGGAAVRGLVRSYSEAEVVQRLPATARALHPPDSLMEIYQQDERFWVIDDRWGMCEINLLRAQWRSWVLSRAVHDPVRCADMAVLWPMAQLLKSRGVHLLPAASAVKDDFGVLLLSPLALEPELSELLSGGYRLIGQRWTGIREENGGLSMLHVPGEVPCAPSPRVRAAGAEEGWIDLTRDRPDALQTHASCTAVLVTEAGRRPRSHLREIEEDSCNFLQRAWPIPDLPGHRRAAPIVAALIRQCRTFQLQLSRDPRDLLLLLEPLRKSRGRAQVA